MRHRLLDQPTTKKLADLGGDFTRMRFERKVPRVEKPHYGVGVVAFVRFGARRQKERIITAPGRQ